MSNVSNSYKPQISAEDQKLIDAYLQTKPVTKCISAILPGAYANSYTRREINRIRRQQRADGEHLT